jgi:ribose transport system substrate-binding protein
MQKHKGIFSIAVVVMIAIIGACGGGKASDETIKLALSVPTLDNPYFVEVANGFSARCKELGAEAVVGDCSYDAAEQYTQFENYIEMGVKGIYVCPVDQKSLQAITAEAISKGIPVACFAQGIDNATSNFVLDDYNYGVVNGGNAAKWINERLGGKAEVLLITLDHVETVKLRGDGMEDTIKELCPNSVIVGRQYAENMETAMKITETMLQAHPNLNAIACVNDQHAIGALEAVRNMGIKNDNFYIGGADYTAEGVQKIKEPGSYFRVTADIQPTFYGTYGAEKLYKYATEGPVEEQELMSIKSIWQDEL